MTEQIVNWITWIATVGSMLTVAWSAYHYVQLRRAEQAEKSFGRVFYVMDMLGRDGSVAAKMAAAYELRKFPDYAEVIIRLCEGVKVDGVSGEMLKTELKLTAEHLRNSGAT